LISRGLRTLQLDTNQQRAKESVIVGSKNAIIYSYIMDQYRRENVTNDLFQCPESYRKIPFLTFQTYWWPKLKKHTWWAQISSTTWAHVY